MTNEVLEIFYIRSVVQKKVVKYGKEPYIYDDAGEIEINSYTYTNSFTPDNFVIMYKEY